MLIIPVHQDKFSYSPCLISLFTILYYSWSLWQVFRFAMLSISGYPVNYSCSPWYRRYSCSPCQLYLSICLYSVLLACTIYTKNLDVNKASSLQTVKGFFQRKKRSAQDFFWWIFLFLKLGSSKKLFVQLTWSFLGICKMDFMCEKHFIIFLNTSADLLRERGGGGSSKVANATNFK